MRDPVSGERDQFFRVAFGTRPGTAVVLSSKKISVIDTANPNHPEMTLLESTGQGRIFTSLDKTAAARGATYTCVCTTYEMLWIDGCNVGPPILAWRHDYGGGRVRDLEVVIEETQTGGVCVSTVSALPDAEYSFVHSRMRNPFLKI